MSENNPAKPPEPELSPDEIRTLRALVRFIRRVEAGDRNADGSAPELAPKPPVRVRPNPSPETMARVAKLLKKRGIPTAG